MSNLHKLTLPRLDPAMESGVIVEWLKKEGDKVSKGEPVVVIEGEKTTFEIESDVDGVLVKILRSAGEEVRVGESIAEIEVSK